MINYLINVWTLIFLKKNYNKTILDIHHYNPTELIISRLHNEIITKIGTHCFDIQCHINL